MNAMVPPPIPVMAAIRHHRTSSYGSGQQTHAGESTDRPAMSDGLANTPASLIQEDFNKYMDAYMKRRQKGQDFHEPSQGPSATVPAARGANPWVTCFTCGKCGHRLTECNGTPLSWDDQIKVRERVAIGGFTVGVPEGVPKAFRQKLEPNRTSISSASSDVLCVGPTICRIFFSVERLERLERLERQKSRYHAPPIAVHEHFWNDPRNALWNALL
jgi:hypothetical protein